MITRHTLFALCFVALFGCVTIRHVAAAQDQDETVEENIGKAKTGSVTDDEVVDREAEAIRLDGISPAEFKQLREQAEKHAFQAEVSRMMKLIINSLYKNKEIFLRELISNASDALDKIRLMSLTDKKALGSTDEMSVKIKLDKDNNMLHITDTGVGMTKSDLVNNLGTIARSGTSEFLEKLMQSDSQQQSELIGQFGVGFYSSFLVADDVIVTSKHNDDNQYIWESDSASFNISPDPRGDTLKRGTTISLKLKEEAKDFLNEHTIKDLVKKYSQFINFDIYLWSSKTEEVEEPIEEAAEDKEAPKDEDEEGKVEEEKEDKPKTKKVEKTTWDWELMNDVKPIWTRKTEDVTEEEYTQFYKTISKDFEDPLGHVHFVAEGEVSFKSVLFVPKKAPYDLFSNYGKKTDNIKLYVRRVFITDDFTDMMPKYLSFVRGLVDSDDLPLNVSRETLQQHKLLSVIKKKLVRKVLDMIKKLEPEQFDEFWKEFSTNLKLGVMEDPSNRTRLSKLIRFMSSADPEKVTSLSDYVERMKDGQDVIYFVAGQSRDQLESSPFVERLLKKGYEVLYLTEPVDEYCIQSLPEFDGKKFQNAAKEGVTLDKSEKAKERKEALEKEFEPLINWLKENALKDQIEKAVVSERLTKSPFALIASQYGWTGNMERIMKSQAYAKAKDSTNDFYATQKKTLEVNPYHPVVKELLQRVKSDAEDATAVTTARLLFEASTLRSGYNVQDQVGFSERIERMLKETLGLGADAEVEEIEELGDEEMDEGTSPVEEEEVEAEHEEL